MIELLVVIAIIGILASVVLASLNTARRKSRDARRLADIKQIQVALELYFDAKDGQYPAVLDDLAGVDACGTASKCMSIVPKPPAGAGQDDYTYASFGAAADDCTSYHIGAVLEESTNQALPGADAAASSLTQCTGSAADFNGVGTDCAGTAGTEACYDVIP